MEIRTNHPLLEKRNRQNKTQHPDSVRGNSEVVFYVKSLFLVLNFPPRLFSSNRKYFFSSEENKGEKPNITQTTAQKRDERFSVCGKISREFSSVESVSPRVCERITHCADVISSLN